MFQDLKAGDTLLVPKASAEAELTFDSSNSSSSSSSEEPNDPNWLKAKRLNSKKAGFVPKNYLQKVFGYFLYAKTDYTPKETDELELIKGDRIEVVQLPDDENGLKCERGEYLLGKLLKKGRKISNFEKF